LKLILFSFSEMSFFFLLIRFFFFYVHNRMFVCTEEIQFYTRIYCILHSNYVHKIKKIGGKQQVNKRKSNAIKIHRLFEDWFYFSPWSEFVDHLATIRLDEERINQYPPNIIILQTAKILFKTVNEIISQLTFVTLYIKAQIAYEQHSSRSASSYEQYAIQYLQTAKANMKNQ
jgi:hypothetical protein